MATQPKTPKDVAIIGMACVCPKAPNITAYWRNIIHGVHAITEATPEHWDTGTYFDPEAKAQDRVYCKHGGFLTEPERRFRPLDYGIMPKSVEGGEPDHFLALRASYEALEDAGYLDSQQSRHRTGIILGKGNYINAGNMSLMQHGWMVEQTLKILKKLRPEYTEETLSEIKEGLRSSLPPFNTEIIPSLIPNIMTGRIANRLDIMGPNYTVDAACASSLIAVDLAVQELQSGRCDLALVGGVQGGNTLLSYMLFCPLGAMSRTGALRSLSRDADGTILGEGIGILVLKPRAQAEADGDTIYAVIKGVGVSSDGKGSSFLAPRLEGTQLAVKRAYEHAGLDPKTVGLLEAHATGTTVGDATEIQCIQGIFGHRDSDFAPCAVGSVKSMIGHLLPASGAMGLIKTTLALYHKVLPQTLHCDHPHPAFDMGKGFFYPSAKTRPWIHGAESHPRRAGVNAFGFGGINAHVILEEYPEMDDGHREHLLQWDSELILLEGGDRKQLIERVEALSAYLERFPEVELRHLAYSLSTRHSFQQPCLALVARSPEDLREKLALASKRLAEPAREQIKDRKGIFFFEHPLAADGHLVFLFPGEGAQYPDMLADLCMHFPVVRRCFDQADRSFLKRGKPYLPSDAIFPRAACGQRDREAAEKLLWQMDVAVEAVLSANQAMFLLLDTLGLQPSVILGHSSGEYSAVLASGIAEGISEELILETNRVIEQLEQDGGVPEAVMLAAAAGREQIEEILAEIDGPIFLAMDNCPHQVVLVGTEAPARQALEALKARRILCEPLPFKRGYHTALFEPVTRKLREIFKDYPIARPRTPIWSCTLKGPYPEAPDALRDLLADHWVEPVAFRETIERLYEEQGCRVFVEVGPRGNLTAFVDDILRGRPYLAVPSNLPRQTGIDQLHMLLGILAAQRIKLDLAPLYRNRRPMELTLDADKDRDAFKAREEGMVTLTMGLAQMDVPATQASQPAEPPVPEPQTPPTPLPCALPERPSETVTGKQAPAAPPPAGRMPAAGPSGSPHPPPTPPPGEHRPIHPPVAAPAATKAMQDYIQNMDQFLQIQQEVMQAYLGRGKAPPTAPAEGTGADNGSSPPPPPVGDPGVPPAPPAGARGRPPLPLAGTVTFQDQDRIRATRRFSLSEDVYLEDHVLAGPISRMDRNRRGLSVVPLTVSMEMMAEVAHGLVPADRVLVAMRDVRTNRWIPVDEQGADIEIQAERVGGDTASPEIEVKVWDTHSPDPSTSGTPKAPILSGRFRFAEGYPAPPPAAGPPLTEEGPSSWDPAKLYPDAMFHGPRFRVVQSVDRSGTNGARATFKVLPFDRLFATSPTNFLTDPLILDAAGQLVGFWTAERLESGFMVFPYRCRELNLYGPLQPTGTRVICTARIELFGHNQVRSDIEMVTPDDRVWMEMKGWEDKRFDMLDTFYRFWLDPINRPFSEPLEAPPQADSPPMTYACTRTGNPLVADQDLWKRVWAHIVLTPAEREAYRTLAEQPERQLKWLLGRTAAKDAFRNLAEKISGIRLGPADIEISENPAGHLQVEGLWKKEEKLRRMEPSLSLTHENGHAVARAGIPTPGEEGWKD